MRTDYGEKRPRVIAALIQGGTDSGIARQVGCSRMYVGQLREELTEELGLPPSSRQGQGKRLSQSAPAQPTHPGTIELDGGTITVEVASEGRALLTVHEHKHVTAVARADRRQLTTIIEAMTRVRDRLPERAPTVLSSLDDLDGPDEPSA